MIALRLLEVAGVGVEDIEQEQLGASESAGAFKDGKIDAFFWSGGLPTSAITDLGATPNTSYALLDMARTSRHEGAVRRVLRRRHHPGWHLPGPGRGCPVDRRAERAGGAADMDEQLAYDMVKTMFEHKESGCRPSGGQRAEARERDEVTGVE